MKILENCKTEYHICMNKDGSAASRYACQELQKYIYQSTNVCIPVFSDKCKKRGPELLIGGARNSFKDLDLTSLGAEGYLVTAKGQDIIFAGNSPRSILYSVYGFLEDMLGFRCFSADCEKVDEKDTLEFIDDIKQIFDFEYRENYWTDSFDGPFCAKNMLNSNLADLSEKLGGKVKWFNFHHSFSDLVSPDKYFDKHPEYFSLIDGKRRKEHTELCLSNEDVFKIALDGVKKWIIANPDCKVFSVSQDEWMGHFVKLACECKNCKAIDDYEESQSGSIITFVNKIAKEIKLEYPDKLIHTFAYQYSRKPPKYLCPESNVIVRLTNIECSWGMGIKEAAIKNKASEEAKFYNDLKGWSEKTSRLYIWDYAVNYRNYLLPFPNIRAMAKNIELYRELGVKGLLMQGNFSYGGKGYFDELKAYVSAKLMCSNKYSLEELMKEFCDNYYGVSGKYIYDYCNLFEDAGYGKKIWLYDDSDHEMFTDDLVKEAKKLLDKAMDLCSNIKYKVRLNKLKVGWEYLYITRLPLDNPNRDELINNFEEEIRHLKITELFERTELEYSLNVMRKSRYCKDRSDWYSLYYIMK